MEILLFGSYVSVSDALVVIWGVTTAHWQYNIRLFPLLPAPFPFDFSVLPISLMIVYQYSPDFMKYFWRSALLCAVFAFGLGRIYVATGIISFYNWLPIYSYILMMTVAIFSRIVITITRQIVESAEERMPRTMPAAIFQPATKPLPEEAEKNEEEQP